jgi:opacity protein-like surface antigen
MKRSHLPVAVLACCLCLAAQSSLAQQSGFGLGIILGEPTGISAKAWTSPVNAFDFGLGWSVGGDRIGSYKGRYDGGTRVHFHMDYLWHAFHVIHSNEQFPLYYGFGGRINNGAGYDGSFAVRGVFGIAWLPRSPSIDIFLELVPSLQLTSATGFGMDAGLGARYYF